MSLFFAVLVSGCHSSPPQNKLHRIKNEGILRVLTRVDPTTYYKSPEGFSGMEYDLVQLFAKRLDVKVEFITPNTFDDILRQIVRDKADIAAAGITITEQRKKNMRFAPSYQEVTEQLLYHATNSPPKELSDVNNGIFEVVKNTSHVETLNSLKIETPELNWLTNEEVDTNGLIYLLNAGLIDYTLSDSNQIELIHRYYPNVEVAFDISEPQQLAWALNISDDSSLYNEVKEFFVEIKKNHTLDRLIDRYYGHINRLGDFENCKFREHIKSRLPKFQTLFEEAAQKHQLDWRMLAAIGYQESHWQTEAISATGVRGLMQLTQDTAEEVGVENRNNARQSIMGGTQYFKDSIAQISDQIPEPDRTWFALAAYNVGLGHLEDARILTKQQRGNPDKWLDVKKRLPLLRQERWYKKTRLGFARGDEPVTYVEKIRSYYDLIVWLTDVNNPLKENAMQERPEPVENKALAIDSPLF